MKELKGKYGNAKIFTDLVESKAIEQITTLLNQEFIDGSKIRIMPDVHAGAGCTIGTTMSIKDKVCPNLVGVDIGCGMLTVDLGFKPIDLEKLDAVIRAYIPSGFNLRKEKHRYTKELYIDKLFCKDHVNLDRAYLSIGTLGGGNHFIEVDTDDCGRHYLVIHSGSRHLGKEVAEHYQHLAWDQVRNCDPDSIKKLIEDLKAQGRQSEIESEIKKAKAAISDIPKDLAYVSDDLFYEYTHDMTIVQMFASKNRYAMASEIISGMLFDIRTYPTFETIHNYIDIYNENGMILRKGAVSAKKDERLLIPMNMRDGSLICVGKGNPDWNYSAPHGAGRIMSRAQARKSFSVEEFAESMNGVYTTSVGKETLDECPMAYKPMESIMNNIGDTVEIEKIIRPIYNFKAGE